MRAPKLVHISRIVFFLTVCLQGYLLVNYPSEYKSTDYAGLAVVFFVPVLLAVALAAHLWRADEKVLINSLWLVWLLYSIGLVVMIGVIFGWLVIGNQHKSDTFCGQVTNGTVCGPVENGTILCGPVQSDTFYAQVRNGNFHGCHRNEQFVEPLRNVNFFGPNVLKTTLSLTPALMLLLLKSVKDNGEQDLKELYFRTTLNLFDGLEMLEVLLEHGQKTHTTPQWLKIVILVVVIIFYLLSPLELLHVMFADQGENETQIAKSIREPKRLIVLCVNSAFQIGLNILFLAIRLGLWIGYKRDAAIFIAKNVIALVMNVLPFPIGRGWILDD